MAKQTKNRGKRGHIAQKKHQEAMYKYWTADEIQHILNTISDLRDKTFFLFAINVGLRISELTNIQTSNIDFERNTIKVWDEKKDQWRVISYPSHVGTQLKIYLNARQEVSPLLFTFKRRQANNIVKQWCKEAGVRLGSTHWFRHTFIRLSQQVGRNIKIVQQNTGDTIETILKWYSDLTPQDRLKEMDEKPLIEKGGVD